MEITTSRENADSLLGVKINMAQFGTGAVLTGADAGTGAQAEIERLVATLVDDQPVFLDFSDVLAVSVPFVDASLGRLLSGRVAGYYETHPIAVFGASNDVRQTIDAALRLHHLYALALGSPGPELLGADEVLATTMQEAVRLVNFNVHQLAESLDLSPQAANNRLRLLLRSGALQRDRAKPERGRGGREFRYRVPAAA
ncbi:hypothetical protein [Conexibacter sp. DBS9H8]|uniref:hypothetical protein n=1 Tax=Conexibacter sp. DBS9H8 TaxID=2937801 RepID=UPI0020108722|nr:hypothetical protein [Conexibacter sp. DBS9H8]